MDDFNEGWDGFEGNNTNGGSSDSGWDDFGDSNTAGGSSGSDWDGFGDNNTGSNSNSGWDDFEGNNTTGSNSNSGWDDFGDSNTGSSSGSGWDDFESNSTTGGSSGSGWDDFESNNTTGDSTQQMSESSDYFIDRSDNFTDNVDIENMVDNTSQSAERRQIALNLSPKVVAFIVAGALIVLAVILLLLDKVHIGKNTDGNTSVSTDLQPTGDIQIDDEYVQDLEVKPADDDTVEVHESTQSSTSESKEEDQGVVLTEIPDSTSLDYSGDMLEANAVVASKLKYLQGHQVLYCIVLRVSFGSATDIVNYYCNYSSFNSVEVDDIVSITYQQISDSFISVNSIAK